MAGGVDLNEVAGFGQRSTARNSVQWFLWIDTRPFKYKSSTGRLLRQELALVRVVVLVLCSKSPENEKGSKLSMR